MKNMRRRMDYRLLVAQKMQVLTTAAAVVLAAPSIEVEEDDEQQFFFAESDDGVTEDSPPVESDKEFAEALLHGYLVTRARRIESHQSEVFIAIAETVLRHLPITPSQCSEWLAAIIPENTRTSKVDRLVQACKKTQARPSVMSVLPFLPWRKW